MRIPSTAPKEIQDSFVEVYRSLDPWIGTQNIDLKQRRFINGGDAVGDRDFITFRQLREQVRGALASISPTNSTNDRVQYGTHATRVATAPQPNGALFWETDRTALYIAIDQVWEFLINQTFYGTLSPNQKPSDLASTESGFLFYSTDFDREYIWTSTAWTDAAASPKRGTIAWFPVTLHADFAPGTGWALCDGTAGVTRSTPSGGTTTFTVPDLTTANRFLRSVAVTTGGTGGSATTHTHTVNPPDTTSGNNSASQVVATGVGTTVAADPHTHNTDIGSFTSGAPSGSGGDDALPPYYNARPYIRL